MKKNPFITLFFALLIMACFMSSYSLIIYGIWNFGISWVTHLPQMPLVTSFALGVLFYIVQFSMNRRRLRKLEEERINRLEKEAMIELRRFFDGEGK